MNSISWIQTGPTNLRTDVVHALRVHTMQLLFRQCVRRKQGINTSVILFLVPDQDLVLRLAVSDNVEEVGASALQALPSG